MSELEIICTVSRPVYDYSDRKYMNLHLDKPTVKKVNKIQFIPVQINPLVDDVLKVKLPFRYKKFEFKIIGDKTIYELLTGDTIIARIKYCGVWNLETFTGHAWKVISIKHQ